MPPKKSSKPTKKTAGSTSQKRKEPDSESAKQAPPPPSSSSSKPEAQQQQQQQQQQEDQKMDSGPMDIDMAAVQELEQKQKQEEISPEASAWRSIGINVDLIHKGVVRKEMRFIARVLRTTADVRRKLVPSILSAVTSTFIPDKSPFAAVFVGALNGCQMDESNWFAKEQAHEAEEEKKHQDEIKSAKELILNQKQKEKEKQKEAQAEVENPAQAAPSRSTSRDEVKRSESDEKLGDKKDSSAAAPSGGTGTGTVTGQESKVEAMSAKTKAEKEKEAADAKLKWLQEEVRREREKITLMESAKSMWVDGLLPEVEVYVSLLFTMYLLDHQRNEEALNIVKAIIARLGNSSFNRRSLDLLSSKVFSFFALVNERLGRFADVRSDLFEFHRTACLRHDEPSQVTLANAILRNFLSSKLYTAADHFRLKITLPESKSNDELAKYLYYLGTIHAIQLNYSEAFKCLTQAIRKAPQRGALGFRQSANKMLVIVQMLMGEIPDRSIFRSELKDSLQPYFQLTKAVRVGNLSAFKGVMQRNKDSFVKDNTYSLIVRLRHNVIKAGLRKICLSYSRISFRDICEKLKLESEKDCEFIVAKAISDNVIDAVINHEEKFVFSKENSDIYSTTEPRGAFDRRIDFCLNIHNEAVKALRYPPNYFKQKAEEEDDDDD